MIKGLFPLLFLLVFLYSCAVTQDSTRSPSAIKEVKRNSKAGCHGLLNSTLKKILYDSFFKDFSLLEPDNIYRIIVGKTHLFDLAYLVGIDNIDGVKHYTFSLLDDAKTGKAVSSKGKVISILTLKKNRE